MEEEIERALNKAMDAKKLSFTDQQPADPEPEKPQPVMVRSITQSNCDNIERVIGQLHTNLATIEQQIAALQERHAQTRRTINAFTTALRMLQS